MGVGWSAASSQWPDAGQVAREQAQRLYHQQMQQSQRHPQQHHMRASSGVPLDLGGLNGHFCIHLHASSAFCMMTHGTCKTCNNNEQKRGQHTSCFLVYAHVQKVVSSPTL